MDSVVSTLKSFFDSVLGVYTPVTVTIDGVTTALSGFAGVDWPYLVRAAAFLLCLWCVFRLLGGLLIR